jgi:hypothetical protein
MMNNNQQAITRESVKTGLHLGSFICQQCGQLIATCDAEKVLVYYMICTSKTCQPSEHKDELSYD